MYKTDWSPHVPTVKYHTHKTNDLIDMNKQNMTHSQQLGPLLIHQMNSCWVRVRDYSRRVCVHTQNCVHTVLYVFLILKMQHICVHVYRSLATLLRQKKKEKKKALSVFLDMRDSSAWLQPAWTIQCRTQWLCNPPWLTGKETLATGTTTQFSSGQEVNPPQLGLGREGAGHTLHMNNFLNEHYLTWWLVS